MKKNLLSMFALATMLLATGCSQEEEPIANNSNDYVDASFTIEMGEEVQSRALGDGVQVNQLYYGIFDQAGNVVPVITNVDNNTGNFTTKNVGEAVIIGHTATVKVRLVKGQTYDFAFWAQVKGNEYYQVDMDNLSSITVNYNTAANDEKRDAFFGQLLDYKVESHFTKTVELRRPFAQLNVGTTLADYKAAEVLLGEAVTHSNLVVKKIPTQLNLLTGEVPETSNVANVKFNMAELPQDINNPANNGAYEILEVDVDGDGKIAADGSENYIHLSMNYLLADVKGGSQNNPNSYLYEVDVEFANADGENIINKINVPNLPIYRNYRTNIIGSILTSTGEFTVIVVPDFYTPDEIKELWDGTTKTEVKEVNGVYSVSKASELAWIAEQVNTGANLFKDKTVKLVSDIDLNNQPWTPICADFTKKYSEYFQGTFDGQKDENSNYVIRNLNVSGSEAAGLFGAIHGATIKNVTLENVKVSSEHYAGAVVAWAESSSTVNVIENCHVIGGSITSDPTVKDKNGEFNGDKVGGIVGYIWGNTSVKNCTVDGLTIKAYRDFGGIVGTIAGGAGKYTGSFESCVLKNTTLIVDNTNNYKGYSNKVAYNVNYIVGRIDPTDYTLPTSNTSAENNTIAYPQNGVNYYKVDGEENSYVANNEEGLSEVVDLLNSTQGTAAVDVKISSDINFGETINGRSATTFQPLATILAGKTLNLDMNGMTLTGKLPDDYAGATSVFNVKKGATLNITGNGKFEVTAGRTLSYVSAIIINEGGIVTIESGDFNLKAGSYAEGYLIPTIVDNNSTLGAATLNIKGGTYTFNRNMFRNFSNHKAEAATINIEGGTFTATADDWGAVWNQDPSNSNGEKAGIVNVTGGTFNYVNIDNEFATGNVTVEDGVAVVVKHWKGDDLEATYTYDNTGLTQIDLTGDHTIVCGTETYFGGATTPSLTINGKAENTLTFENSYRSYIKLANPEGKLIINDITVTQSKESGTWDEYDVIFMCDVECNDVTFAKSVAVEKNATFKGVTINETHDYYALWITAEGQKVDIDGLTVNCAGRGIAIKDEYVKEPAKVKLNVSNATFKTAKKAAILVTSTAGADITLNNVDINNVTADQTNAVWVDSGNALNYDAVTVQGGSKVIEGTIAAGVATENNDYYIYSKAGLEWLANQTASAAYGKGLTFNLVTDVDLDSQEWTPIGGSGRAFQGIFDGHDHTISNLYITGYKSDVGLFGVTTDGEIRNLTVNNAKVSGRLDVGVVSGTPYTSKYTNIKVTGHVEVNGMSYVGAVGGKNAYANWTDVTIDVDGTSYVKANSIENGTAYRTYVGGACGFNGEGGHTFANIKSNINVEGTTCDVGGLFGIAHYGNNFVNCSSSGNVTITKAADAEVAEEIGGIAGVWHNGGADVTFDGCSYTGKLSTNIASVDLSDNTIHGKAYSATGTGQVIVK